MGIRDRLKSSARVLAGRLGQDGGREEHRRALERYQRATEGLPTEPDEEGFRAVSRSEGVPDGGGRTFRVEGSRVAIFRHGGRLQAVDDSCTHEDGPLGEGSVDEHGVITCPYHGWRFRLSDGACLTREDRGISCWPLKEVEGVVWVQPRAEPRPGQRGGDHDDGLPMGPKVS